MSDRVITKYVLYEIGGSAAAAQASASAAAAAGSATSAAGSAAAAAGSAVVATAKATEAANSATAAAGSATGAANSATAAAGSASGAAGSAALALVRAQAAEQSSINATNAAAAAGDAVADAQAARDGAVAAANNAAGIYDAFDDRYLGAKSADPLTDNDGNALIVGVAYFNTVENEWRIWNGSGWQDMPFSLPGALMTANNLADVPSKSIGRANLGVAIGVHVQAFNAQLDAIAALTTTPFGRALLELAGGDALALLTRSQLDARYTQPAQIPPPAAMWYGFRDSGNGVLLIDQISPFEVVNIDFSTWNLNYADGASAFGYLIGLNIVNIASAGVTYSYESTPEQTASTAMSWGFRDDNGVLIVETLNPLAGQVSPATNWNMYFDTGALAYGVQSIFEIIPNVSAGIVLNY